MNAPAVMLAGGRPDGGDSVLVAKMAKNKVDELVVSLTHYRGHKLVDVRVYSRFDGFTETRPTRKGVCLNVALLPALITALNAAAAEAHRLGLLPQAEPDQPPVNGTARAKDRTAAERQRRRRERLRVSRDAVTDVTDPSVTAPSFFPEH